MRSQYIGLVAVVVLSALAGSLISSEINSESDSGICAAPEKAVTDGWKIGATQSILTKELGLQEGDVVLRVNGNKFSGSLEDFTRAREHCRLGKPVSIEFWRDGTVQTRQGKIDLSKAERPINLEFGTTQLTPISDDS